MFIFLSIYCTIGLLIGLVTLCVYSHKYNDKNNNDVLSVLCFSIGFWPIIAALFLVFAFNYIIQPPLVYVLKCLGIIK